MTEIEKVYEFIYMIILNTWDNCGVEMRSIAKVAGVVTHFRTFGGAKRMVNQKS